MTLPQATQDRITRAAALGDELARKLKRLQEQYHADLSRLLDTLDIDSIGRIKYTAANLRKIRSIQAALRRSAPKRKNFLQWIATKALEVLGLNKAYFSLLDDAEPEKVEKRVVRLVMLRLGYDTGKSELVRGGWLDSLSDNTPLVQLVARDIVQAIAAKMTMRQFKKQFRDAFTGEEGLGYLERHYNTFTRDLFQQVDREAQNQYAEALELPYALYSGTAMERTRDFCLERFGNYYSREEIVKWEELEFQGKLKVGYNPLVHCGGYNCRHHLSWVSKELLEAKGILPDKVNKYNSIVHA